MDAVSRSQPDVCLPVLDDDIAKADGLTMTEAIELATWLTETGYDSIDTVHQSEGSSVTWQRCSLHGAFEHRRT